MPDADGNFKGISVPRDISSSPSVLDDPNQVWVDQSGQYCGPDGEPLSEEDLDNKPRYESVHR